MLTCATCSSQVTERPYHNEYWPHLAIFDELTVATCTECGFGFVPNPPSASALRAFYATEYRAPGSPYFIGSRRRSGREPFRSRAIAQIQTASRYVDLRRDGSVVIDIGAGLGEVVRMMGVLNPSSQRYAIEDDLEAVRHLRWLTSSSSHILASLSDFKALGNGGGRQI